MIHYTDEELERLAPNDEILPKVIEAQRRGDNALAMELRRQMIYPPVALLGLKRNLGPNWIRESGFNTIEAERKFGKDWLERDNEELTKILWA